MNTEPTREQLSREIVDTCLAMNSADINQGSAGNVSQRYLEGFLITPSGVAYERLQAENIVYMKLDGSVDGDARPSSEWRMHRDIYAANSDAGAVLHAHPTFATALSCQRRGIPPFHYMIAVAGGNDIRCADYALFGTQELSDNMLAALEDRRACLLGTHGMICYHDNLARVLWLAVEVEALARQYLHTLQLGEPVLLNDAEMAAVIERFSSYGSDKD